MGKTSIKSFFSNMQVDMPFITKVRLAVKNNMIKIRTGSKCCGHPGEPGC